MLVTDIHGNALHPTYPKRAKGLVKSGRARFVEADGVQTAICLTRPSDTHSESEDENMEDFRDNNGNIVSQGQWKAADGGKLEGLGAKSEMPLFEENVKLFRSLLQDTHQKVVKGDIDEDAMDFLINKYERLLRVSMDYVALLEIIQKLNDRQLEHERYSGLVERILATMSEIRQESYW